MLQTGDAVLLNLVLACSFTILSLCRQKARAGKHLKGLQARLSAEKSNRAAERAGRIRAEVHERLRQPPLGIAISLDRSCAARMT
jgi:hypothetical protein